MNSCDLRLLSRLPELAEAGICSFKVEGRMKSEFYVATVATAYRRALDEYIKTGNIENADKYNTILENISHRAYTEAYLDGENTHTVSLEKECLEEKFRYIATVLKVLTTAAGSSVTVEMRNRFKTGDNIIILSPSDTNGKSFTMGEITHCEDGAVTDDAKLVQHIYSFFCPFKLTVGDLLVIENK